MPARPPAPGGTPPRPDGTPNRCARRPVRRSATPRRWPPPPPSGCCRGGGSGSRSARRPAPWPRRSARSTRPGVRPCPPARRRTSRGTGLRHGARPAPGSIRRSAWPRIRPAYGSGGTRSSSFRRFRVRSRRRGAIARSAQRRSPVRRARPRCARRAPGSAPSRSPVIPGGSSAGTAPAGVSTSVQRPRAFSCGCAQTSAMPLTCALAICASSSSATSCAASSAAKRSTMIVRSASRFPTRAGLAENRSSLASSGRPSTFSQNTCHSRSF